jgi:hypothetical protein
MTIDGLKFTNPADRILLRGAMTANSFHFAECSHIFGRALVEPVWVIQDTDTSIEACELCAHSETAAWRLSRHGRN